MGTLSLGVALLVAGYLTYGFIGDLVFGSDPPRPTPALSWSVIWRYFSGAKFLRGAGKRLLFRRVK